MMNPKIPATRVVDETLKPSFVWACNYIIMFGAHRRGEEAGGDAPNIERFFASAVGN